MTWLRQFLFKFGALFLRKKLEREMAKEMALHLEERTRLNVEAGMDPDQARSMAQREFGGVEQVKERARDERGWMWVDAMRRDLRQATTVLWRSPLFAIVAVA